MVSGRLSWNKLRVVLFMLQSKFNLPTGSIYLEADGWRLNFDVLETTNETNQDLQAYDSEMFAIERSYILIPHLPEAFLYNQLSLKADWQGNFDDMLMTDSFYGGSFLVGDKVVGLVCHTVEDLGKHAILDPQPTKGETVIAYQDIDEEFADKLWFQVIIKDAFSYQAINKATATGDLSLYLAADALSGLVIEPRAIEEEPEYIYCSVTFEEDGPAYRYLTDDDSISVGDWVEVPVGSDNHHQKVKVVAVDYYLASEVPYPLEKMKQILGKCEPDKTVPQTFVREDSEKAQHYLDLGVKAYLQEQYDLAAECYQTAADLGSSQAACNLGYIYAYGRLGHKDPEQAFYYFTQASVDGNANGSYRVGDAYFYGDFVAKNLLLAFKYYQQAEEFLEVDDDVETKLGTYYRLARCYHYGFGVAQDDLRALDYINLVQIIYYAQDKPNRNSYWRQKIENLRTEVLKKLDDNDD